MSNIIDSIQVSGTVYQIQGSGGGNNVIELTQAQYNALVDKDPTVFYIITDAEAVDLANYYTKSETSGATQISTALNAKADTATTYTKTEVDTALATKQATLVSGTNIKTINNESILGSGNIDIQGGGGSTYTAGTNISITNDTINCTIPITASSSIRKNDIAIGNDIVNGASDYRRITIGNGNNHKYNSSRTSESILIGTPSSNSSIYNVVNASDCIGIGGGGLEVGYDNPTGYGSIAIGYNSKSIINKSVAIGYNTVASGTTQTNINNQLKIDTSNQVYISNSANTSTYCLQEKIENTEAALGGLSLVKLSQAEYNALATKDSMTLYIIVNETTDNDKVMIAWTSGDGTQGTNIVLWDSSVSLPPTDLFNSLTVNDVDVMSTVGQDGTLENYSTSNTNYLVKYELINDSTITNIFSGNLGGGWGSTVGNVDFLIPSQVTEIQMIPQNTGTLVILAETPPQCAFYNMLGGVYVPDNAVSTYESQWSGVPIYPISDYQGNLPV